MASRARRPSSVTSSMLQGSKTSSPSTPVQGQAIEVKVSPTVTWSPSTATERTSPRSTMPTPSSGSSTSARAARTSSALGMSSHLAAPQLAVAALQHGDELLVARSAPLPAQQHVVPGDGATLEVPALALGVEAHGEGAVDQVAAALLVAVGGDREAEPLAQRHRRRHPRLAELVVGEALELVADLLAVALELVGQPEPLQGEHEHPVDRLLHLGLGVRVV